MPPQSLKILVLNTGSSTHKISLYDIGPSFPKHPSEPIWNGVCAWVKNSHTASLHVTSFNGSTLKQSVEVKETYEGVKRLLDAMTNGKTQVIKDLNEIAIVGHRIVHGGAKFQQPTKVTAEVKAAIKQLFPLAPLHNAANLKGIEIMEHFMPSIPQVAVFDTSFHHTLPMQSKTYPIPYEWTQMGIQRYGFHGISHRYCSERCATLLERPLNTLKIISCHLGNGASLAAIHQGRSVDTTMGFTPLEGLMMGSRCGSIDPSILLYLEREKKYSYETLDLILNDNSGLKGVSGVSEDMREILKLKNSGHARAALAFEMYVHSLKRHIGAMAAVLEGVNVILFTAGIGENVPELREAACQAFQQLGVKLDLKKNRQCQPDAVISSPDSAVDVLVIHTREEWSIAQDCWKLAHAQR
jgi:acetate kinase